MANVGIMLLFGGGGSKAELIVNGGRDLGNYSLEKKESKISFLLDQLAHQRPYENNMMNFSGL